MKAYVPLKEWLINEIRLGNRTSLQLIDGDFIWKHISSEVSKNPRFEKYIVFIQKNTIGLKSKEGWKTVLCRINKDQNDNYYWGFFFTDVLETNNYFKEIEI